jgi:metal-responsive CopG/Arc/MetJ family transcriptional regulator
VSSPLPSSLRPRPKAPTSRRQFSAYFDPEIVSKFDEAIKATGLSRSQALEDLMLQVIEAPQASEEGGTDDQQR